MKVIIKTPTGIGREALIDKDSGVLEYQDGEISHVLFEKQMQRTIHVLKDAPKKEEVKEQAKEEAPSAEQGKPVKKAKTK